MDFSKRIQKQLIKHEGLKLKPYRCPAGKLTIGVGHNLDDNGITKEEAIYLLRNDIERCASSLKHTFSWFDDLDTVRQDVLVNMCFQMGLGGFLGFTETIKLLAAHDYEKAAFEMLDSKWARDFPSRAKELASQMQTGEYE